MKKLPIKWKIMLWYSGLLVLLLAAALVFMYYILSGILQNDARQLLQSKSDDIAESLEIKNNTPKLDHGLDLAGSGVYVAVYSSDNRFIAGKLPQGFQLKTGPHFGDIYEARTEGPGNHGWLVEDSSVAQDGTNIGWFRAIKPLDAIDRTLDNFTTVMLLTIPLYLAVALASGFLIAKRSLAPITEITNTAKQITTIDLSKRIRLNGPKDEVGLLAETFDEMLGRLEDSFTREKRFTSDVSHELRTPVSAIMVNAEEALSSEKTICEYNEIFSTILAESKKMNSMISQLLMMARNDNSRYQFEMEDIDVSHLTRTIVEDYQESQSSSGIQVTAEIEDKITLFIEQTLYMRLLVNLIDNALKYNKPDGFVNVSLKRENDRVILSVEDGGIGISEEHLPKIWDRFYKAEPSRPDSSPGLGLSIVKWIADLHGAAVQAVSVPEKGSIFEVIFKYAR